MFVLLTASTSGSALTVSGIPFIRNYYQEFDIAVKYGTLLASILFFFLGGLKSVLKDYHKKQRSAIFSFYTNLSAFIECLLKIVADKNNQQNPSDVFKQIFGNVDVIKNATYDNQQILLLRQVAVDFLHYFFYASNQISPCSNKDDDAIWCSKRNNLIYWLNRFICIPQSGYPELKQRGKAGPYTAEQLQDEYSELYDLLKHFNSVIQEKREDYFMDLGQKEKLKLSKNSNNANDNLEAKVQDDENTAGGL